MNMALFPVLPVLEAAASLWDAEDRRSLDRTWFICCQHLLETTGSLAETLIRLGAAPSRMFVVGKVYSTHGDTADQMRAAGIQVRNGTTPSRPGQFDQVIHGDTQTTWRDALAAGAMTDSDRIVVLDDGGYCARSMPGEVISSGRCIVIEQTSSGMAGPAGNGTWQTPVIAVAASAAKRVLEAPLIVAALARRLNRMEEQRNGGNIGVLGLGALGCALVASLRDKGLPLCAFDRRKDAMHAVAASEVRESAEALLRDSGFVIGCSGERSIRAEWLPKRTSPLILASASSGDREFGDVLERWADRIQPVQEHVACPDLLIPPSGGQCPVTLLRSGYPVNFDNTSESVPRDQIQLTRGLLLAGVLQAMRLPLRGSKGSDTLMLDCDLQRHVVQSWLRAGARTDLSVAARFADLAWIRRESRGKGVVG